MTDPATTLRRFARSPAHREERADRPRVALVRGPILSTRRAFNNEATPCIAFAYLSAYIKRAGYTCEIVDAIGEGLGKVWPSERHAGYVCQGLTFEEICARIPEESEVIGFSTMFSGEWPVSRDLIAFVRKRFPDALFVGGGEHITALPEYSLRDCPDLDLCVRGEGEHVLLEVLEAYSHGGDVREVNGISFLDADGSYRENNSQPRLRAVDTIPWPDWPPGYLERFWEAGRSYGIQTERDMPIMASRGCPYRCTFCSSPSMWTTQYVLRNPDDLIAEIESYIERYDITSLQFYDLTAIIKKEWTIEYCRKLVEHGIHLKWSLPSGTRSEALDHESLKALKDTNCTYLVYAPESGSPETLKRIKKKIHLDRLTDSVLTAKRLGIVLRTNLIIGFPHERRKNVFETIRYGLYLAWKGVDEVSINIYSPYPGTEIFRELQAENRIAIGDPYFLALTSLNSDYTSINPLTCNPAIGPRELAVYRLGFMLTNYALGYLRYPSRILRTFRNLFTRQESATVFEHRLKDMLKRRKLAA